MSAPFKKRFFGRRGELAGVSLVMVILLSYSGGVLSEVPSSERAMELRVESPIMLTKGSVTILDADLDGYLHSRVPPDEIPELLRSAERLGRILENIVRTNALSQLAMSEGLLDTPHNQARLIYAAARQAEAIYREHYLAEIQLESYEAQGREMYLARPSDFKEGPRVSFDHLLLTVGSDRSETETMRLIVDLHEKLSSGSDFIGLAEQYSDDTTFSENTGSYTDIDPGQLVPGLANALDTLSEGEWSDPVRSQFGWHLARLTERSPGRQLDWEEARPTAIRAARQQHLATALERLVRDVFDAEAVFTEGTIERLYERYGVPTDGVIEIPEIEG